MVTTEIFPVRRRLFAGLGWGFIVMALLWCLLLLWRAAGPSMILSALVLFGAGWFFLRAARNLQEIRVDAQAIHFLPCGIRLPFDQITRLHLPGWAGRGDVPDAATGRLTLETTVQGWRFVPGVIRQWPGGAMLWISGSESNRLVAVLRSRLGEARIG